jgi:hypothetical protein
MKHTFKNLQRNFTRRKDYVTRFITSRIRLFWSRLYIRKDEFDSTLNSDFDALCTMSPKQRERYWKDLVRRRDIAHQRELRSS